MSKEKEVNPKQLERWFHQAGERFQKIHENTKCEKLKSKIDKLADGDHFIMWKYIRKEARDKEMG